MVEVDRNALTMMYAIEILEPEMFCLCVGFENLK